jgi:hypothetical protein
VSVGLRPALITAFYIIRMNPELMGTVKRGMVLTTVTESPSGAAATPLYADNIKYLNLIAAESFEATIEAFTYPDSFAECDGTVELTPGVFVGQQSRKLFGLCYRSRIGNDLDGQDHGYRLHLVYGALAAPSQKAYATVNDSPEAIAFSWTVSTTPVAVTDNKPTALLTIDSTKVDATRLAALLDILYGTVGDDPRLPLPNEVLTIMSTGETNVDLPMAQISRRSTMLLASYSACRYRCAVEGQWRQQGIWRAARDCGGEHAIG